MQPDFTGKHVLLLDDILDTSLTLEAVTRKLKEHGAEGEKYAEYLLCTDDTAEVIDALSSYELDGE